MKENNTKNRINNIIKDLHAKEEQTVLTAIKQLRKHGTPEVIDPLLALYMKSDKESIKNDITSLLFDLKDEAAVPVLIQAIENEKYLPIQSFLISVLWQAAIDSSSYISTLVTQAIQKDYYTCLEVLSVIDSYDSTFDEAEIEDLKFDIEDAMEEADEEKRKLLQTLKMAIEELNIAY